MSETAGARPPAHPSPSNPRIVRVISHSMLFYWWPVWTVGLLLALLTYTDGHRLAIVPIGTSVKDLGDGKYELTTPSGSASFLNTAAKADTQDPFPVRIAQSKNYGVLYGVILLAVIAITTIPLRGVASLVLILIVVLGSIILALAGWWEPILEATGRLQIYVNTSGYLLVAVVLFLLWLGAFAIFDRQTALVFAAGQVRVSRLIGSGETVYDTRAVTFEKRRSDLFRHWVLGLGSGDLIVHIGGPHGQTFEWPNVLFIDAKVREISNLLAEQQVVAQS